MAQNRDAVEILEQSLNRLIILAKEGLRLKLIDLLSDTDELLDKHHNRLMKEISSGQLDEEGREMNKKIRRHISQMRKENSQLLDYVKQSAATDLY